MDRLRYYYREYRKARKAYQCVMSGPEHWIGRGERHAVYVAMPWTDSNMAPTPWRVRVCLNCDAA